MKKPFLILGFLVGTFGGSAYGQGNVQCGIFFGHDAVGNRIKRSYDCKTLGQTWTAPGSTVRMAPPKSETTTFKTEVAEAPTIIVYPNPTSGAFTIKLSTVPKEPLHFHWYNDQLQILGSGTITGASFNGDISRWADGVYILRVYDKEKMSTFKIVKVASTGR